MAHIGFIGDVKREYHHVKVLTDGHEEYEPAMVLFRPQQLGKSFIIPLNSMWKYLEPDQNRNVMAWDLKEFDKMAQQVYMRRMITPAGTAARRELDDDAAGIVFAEACNAGSGVLLCTAFSLYKACVILGLTVGQQTMAQLLMFIQDGLEELQRYKPAEAEDRREEGEAVIRIDGKTYHVPVETTATDLARDQLG